VRLADSGGVIPPPDGALCLFADPDRPPLVRRILDAAASGHAAAAKLLAAAAEADNARVVVPDEKKPSVFVVSHYHAAAVRKVAYDTATFAGAVARCRRVASSAFAPAASSVPLLAALFAEGAAPPASFAERALEFAAAHLDTVDDPNKDQAASTDNDAASASRFVCAAAANAAGRPFCVDAAHVLGELRAVGLCALVEARAEGCPIVLPHAAFLREYGGALGESAGAAPPKHKSASRLRVDALLRKTSNPARGARYHVGVSRVFLSPRAQRLLEEGRAKLTTPFATTVQRWWRASAHRNSRISGAAAYERTVLDAALVEARRLRVPAAAVDEPAARAQTLFGHVGALEA